MSKRVYCIEVLERNKDTDEEEVIFSTPFHGIPVKGKKPKNRKELEERIKTCDKQWYEIDAMTNRVWFILNQWYPKNFYRIVIKGVDAETVIGKRKV